MDRQPGWLEDRRICWKCGADYDDDVVICTDCGVDLRTGAEAGTGTDDVPEDADFREGYDLCAALRFLKSVLAKSSCGLADGVG